MVVAQMQGGMSPFTLGYSLAKPIELEWTQWRMHSLNLLLGFSLTNIIALLVLYELFTIYPMKSN